MLNSNRIIWIAVMAASLMCFEMACTPPSDKTADTTPATNTGLGNNSDTTSSAGEPTATPKADMVKGQLPPNEAQKIIESTAQQAVAAIATQNYQALSAMIDPAKGLRFTPYTYISGKEVSLSPQEVAAAAGSTKIYHWGEFDGSGEPIDMTIKDYFARFVYNYDYAKKAQSITYNQPVGKGNSVNNQREKHPNAIIVEYHIPQNDPKYEGMDWGSLYLIFEQDEAAQWKLVNVAHGQWTS